MDTTSFWRDVIDPRADRTPLSPGKALAVLAGTLALYGCYGLAAGFFQGDEQLLVSAFKVPLILSATLLLCIPSLFVLALLSGAQLTVSSFLTAVLGFAGRLGLLAVAVLPIVWLFSVSTQYLFVLILMHVFALAVALALCKRALVWPGRPAGGLVALWLVLVFFVALQVATLCRPVLLSEADGDYFESGKLFFLEHFNASAGKESP